MLKMTVLIVHFVIFVAMMIVTMMQFGYGPIFAASISQLIAMSFSISNILIISIIRKD